MSAGILAVVHATGLGATAGGVTVASGATLDLQNISVGAEATTLNGGTLLVSTGTSSLGGTVALGANSTVNVAGTQLTISGAISGTNFGYTKSGAGDLILTATNAYTGATTISAGTLIFQNDAPSLTSSSFAGPGSLVIKPNGTSFTSAYTFDESLSAVTKLSALTLGKSGNAANITVSTAANVAGPITIYGGNIVISNALNTTGATGSTGVVSLYASDTIKVSSNITTTGAAVLITSNTDGLNGGAINLNASTITAGSLTIPAGSTSAINYIQLASGAILNPGTIGSASINLPGYVILDNTYGCATTGCTPYSGYLNSSLANWATLVTSSHAITVTAGNPIYAASNITINGVSAGGRAVLIGSNLISSTGNINVAGTATNAWSVTNYDGTNWLTALITANNGAINITGISTTTGSGIVLGPNNSISAKSITIYGSEVGGSYAAYLNTLTLVAGGSNLNATDTGIYQAGAITGNAVGSSITFISNGKINQTGAIALVANTGAPVANVIYDTTGGNKSSDITSGTLSFTSSASTVINFIAKSAGSAIATSAIGTSAIPLPGYVLIDNSFGCATSACTPASGYVVTGNASTLATASAGATISGAIYAIGNINIKGLSSGASGINYAAAIKSTGDAITLTGMSTTTYGIYGSTAASIVTASSTTAGLVRMTGTSTLSTATGIYTASSATITGGAGVYLMADGAGGSINAGAQIENTGSTSGVTVNAYGNVNLTGVRNTGINGITIIAGRGIAAGTTSGGNVTAVGTLSNSGGGVIAVSMALPGSATGDAIATALGITSANADVTKNLAYGIVGGTPVKPSGYISGNYISYRQKISNTVTVNATLNADYSAVYGTGYNSSSANAWLQANSTISYTGAITATFGLPTVSLAYIKSALVFSPTVGGTTSANGTNANAVQSATLLTAASISSTDGSIVNVTPAGHTYTVTPAILGISVSGVYNGTSTFTSANATITTTGLASWDKITNVTVSASSANGVGTYVTGIAGNTPATVTNTFSSLNYLINAGYNNTLASGLPVNATQSAATNIVSITPAPLGVTINAIYSGTTTVTPTSFVVTGLVNSQTISGINSATINAINVAANNSNYVTAITIGSGTASISNYSITAAYSTVGSNTQNTVTLTPKVLTVTGITIAPKIYDGTKSATVSGGSLVGVAVSDIANVTLAQSATFVSANAANNVAISNG
ncbi:beta strand repeat-containing protein [Polynucleobacter necessarius]|uniref:beta strand repeat-containing protein n=1 Tax=Polynucleobacter necessarius TaxID=576610 RepID=UPI000FE1DA5A|nr:autotransporter-associated beta strand repeat-containing protein [Polynucleobacter necessarius]